MILEMVPEMETFSQKNGACCGHLSEIKGNIAVLTGKFIFPRAIYFCKLH